jgi:D-glycero-D-manno-heptose 1,7-bisphosphate phosphatase
LADFEAVNAALWKALQGTEAHYDALYYCPHVPDGDMPCACRKPQPGLLLQAAFDLDLDLRRSFMVGDKRSDLEAGRACGCHTVLVRTGWGDGAYQEMVSQGCEPDYVAATLLDASRWIVSQL